jgi:hypothetical protein
LSIEVATVVAGPIRNVRDIDTKRTVVFLGCQRVALPRGDFGQTDDRQSGKGQTTPKEKLDSSWENEYDVAVRQVV